MNPLAKSLGNIEYTQNGALSYASTGSACLDLFSKVGSARNMEDADLIQLFYHAVLEDSDMATRIMMWVRDCRGGAGERDTFRKLLKEFESWCNTDPVGHSIMSRVVDKIVELGRWDDLFVLDKFFYLVVTKVVVGLQDNDQLLKKWLPREGSANKAIAKRLMLALNLTPKEYRKICSSVTTTETLMCAKKWEEINLSHVPSVASTRYQKAFERNHPRYTEWKTGLIAGTEKVNASVSFPHDVWRAIKADADNVVSQAMWDSLPNYIPEGVNILPITDVSSSMQCAASGSLSCMDISIGLGAYLATKNTGPFANMLITFADHPEFHLMGKDTIAEEMRKIERMSWGRSTNFQATFELILNHAKKVNASQNDMPQYIMCVSDMQFDSAAGRYRLDGNSNITNFEAIEQKYKVAGYQMPKLVFWQVNSGYGNDTPATTTHANVALVSGFSPAILKTILAGGDCSPVKIMEDVVMIDRYKVLDE